MSDSNGAATIPSGSNGAAMSFASSSSINAGVSSGQSIGTINYTDSRSNGNSSDLSQQRFINPLKKKEVTKVLNIDSRFRDNYYTTTSTEYNIKLPLSFEKVTQMELMHIELPLTFYAITKEKGNNYFWIKMIPFSTSGITSDIIFQVEFEDGNYTTSQIAQYMEQQILIYIPDTVTSDTSFNVTIDSYTNKLSLELNQTATTFSSFEINFSCPYMEDEIYSSASDAELASYYNASDGSSLQLKLGWALGFRFSKYSASTFATGEAPYENPLPRYLYLAIDDYNNNVNNCIFSAFNSSILNKNILAKLGYYGSSFDIYKVYKVDDGQHYRTYFGPVTIRKLSIKVIDEYGRQVDLNNMDFSFGLALTCLYD
tara:strand:+ start:45 stop:1157 length:1113 start_codon:yes stop_codon:yes gene_type:complete